MTPTVYRPHPDACTPPGLSRRTITPEPLHPAFAQSTSMSRRTAWRWRSIDRANARQSNSRAGSNAPYNVNTVLRATGA
jgi:hypothetical protein